MLCREPGCDRPSAARGRCKRDYQRWWRASSSPVAEAEPRPKVAYLRSLSRAELAAYCTDVLSQASGRR